jgi:hypothetical protein
MRPIDSTRTWAKPALLSSGLHQDIGRIPSRVRERSCSAQSPRRRDVHPRALRSPSAHGAQARQLECERGVVVGARRVYGAARRRASAQKLAHSPRYVAGPPPRRGHPRLCALREPAGGPAARALTWRFPDRTVITAPVEPRQMDSVSVQHRGC